MWWSGNSGKHFGNFSIFSAIIIKQCLIIPKLKFSSYEVIDYHMTKNEFKSDIRIAWSHGDSFAFPWRGHPLSNFTHGTAMPVTSRLYRNSSFYWHFALCFVLCQLAAIRGVDVRYTVFGIPLAQDCGRDVKLRFLRKRGKDPNRSQLSSDHLYRRVALYPAVGLSCKVTS
jgi:hypothetical protein